MAKKTIRPRKNRVRKANAAIKNTQRDSEMSEEMRQAQLDKMYTGQNFTYEWNTEKIGKKGMDDKDLSTHFDNLQLENNHIIIHAYLENPMKDIVKDEEGKVISMDYFVRQIDYRSRNTDKAQWGPTPFPIINKGVIMAISPYATLQYYDTKKKMAEVDPEAAEKIIIPKKGDIVYLNQFTYKEHRYYVDKQKQCEDFVKTQEEVRLRNFDFLFKISPFEIEAIVPAENADKMFDKPYKLS